VQFVSLLSSKVALDLLDMDEVPPATQPVQSTVQRLLTTIAPRGPPTFRPAHPPHFTPPLRGPPVSQA